MIITTLVKIREHGLYEYGWEKLLSGLNKTKADNDPLPLVRILEINGIQDAIWALRAINGYDNAIRLFAYSCTRYALPFFKHFTRGQTIKTAQATQSAAGAAAGAVQDAVWDTAIQAAQAARYASPFFKRSIRGQIIKAAKAAKADADSVWDTAIQAAQTGAAWAAARDATWAYIEKEFLQLCQLEGKYRKVD